MKYEKAWNHGKKGCGTSVGRVPAAVWRLCYARRPSDERTARASSPAGVARLVYRCPVRAVSSDGNVCLPSVGVVSRDRRAAVRVNRATARRSDVPTCMPCRIPRCGLTPYRLIRFPTASQPLAPRPGAQLSLRSILHLVKRASRPSVADGPAIDRRPYTVLPLSRTW